MSFKRSWSRRLAAILSAVMVVSTAAPISVPAMEAKADDILSPAVTEENIAEADNAGNNIGNMADGDAALAEESGDSLAADDSTALAADEDALLDSGDELAAELTEGALTDELAEGTELIDETDTLIEEPETAEDETYTGKLRLNTVSAGLVKKIEYKFDNEISWNEVDVTKDGLKAPIPFSGAKYVSFKLKDAASSSATIWVSDGNDGYRVNFWVEGYSDDMQKITSTHESPWDTASFSLKDYNFKQNGILDLNVSALINKNHRKKGNLIIHVASENRIPGTDKVISINKVKVQLGAYAIEYDDSGSIVTAKYRDTPSVNNIGVGGYDGTITLPYWCANHAKIWIDDTYTESGLDPKYSRYAYTVQDSIFYNSNNTKLDEWDNPGTKGTIDLAEDLDVDTHVTVGVKQMNFDPTIRFITTSNRIMTGFKVTANDGFGHTSEYDINALSDNVVKTQEFSNARKLQFYFDNFTVRDGASEEFKRDSLNDKNWVYRIEYMGTDGKAVSKSLFYKPYGDPIEIEADSNGRFPEEIKVSAIPNVKVTLSANGTKQYNRDKANVFQTIEWEDENGKNDTGSTSTGVYSFWVEPERTVWIKKISGGDYIFPYIEEAAPTYKGEDSVLQFTLPKITEDRVFSVSFYEFDLEDKDLITVTNSVRNDDGKPGKASVSINGFSGFGSKGVDGDEKSPLFGKKVLAAQIDYNYYVSSVLHYYYERQLEIQIKMDSTESLEYTFDKISYDYYNFTNASDVPVKAEHRSLNGFTEADPSQYEINYKISKDEQGNQIATVYIPTRWILFTLIKKGKFELNVTEHEARRKSSVALSEGTPGTIKTASVMLEGEYRYAINRDGYSTSGTILYGSDMFLKAEPAEGFNLVSVDIVCPSNSSNNETVTDAKKLAAFASDEGYKYTIKEGVNVTFYTEPVYCATVRYKTGSDELKPKNGKYSIDHKRPVLVQYKNGNAAPSGYNCDIFVGSAMITSNEGITKSGDIYTVDANKGDLAGKNVTFKFYTGDGSRTDKSLKTVVLSFDKADTGVKFGADKYSIPLGAQKDIPAGITGSFDAKAILADGKTGLDCSLDFSRKKLIVKSTNDSKADTYTVNIVNIHDPGVVYGSVVIELETTTVKTAPAPLVTIIGTTNRSVTVGLNTQKIDTSIKGLCYKVQIKTKDQKKGYFEVSKTVYVPVTEKSVMVDMANSKMKQPANICDGDVDAVFEAEVWIVQRNTSGTEIVTSTASGKADNIKFKEGKVFETRLRLKKISKGKIYNTMSSGNAYRIGVVYSKKTEIQMLDPKLELLTGSGEEVDYPSGRSLADYLKIEDDYTISFYPGGTGSIKTTEKLKFLSPGTYIIKAYALEPNGLEVGASIKVNVEKGMSELNLKGAPGVLYKQKNKALSLQLTATGSIEDHMEINLQGEEELVISEFPVKKVRYEIVDEKNTGGFVKISKSGRITVNKKLEPDNTEFTVRVTADDFERVPGTELPIDEMTIKIRSNYGIDELSIAHCSDGSQFFSVDSLYKLGNSHYLSELKDFNPTDKQRFMHVPKFKITVYEKNRYDKMNYYVPSTFKVSGAGKLVGTGSTIYPDGNGTYGTVAEIEITDITKDLKITAYAADGSGRKIKNYKVKIKGADGKLGILIADGYITDKGADHLDDMTIQLWDYGNTDLKCDSYASEKDGMGMLICGEYYDEEYRKTAYTAAKCRISSVKGGKVFKYNLYQYRIMASAPQTTFTVTDLTSNKDYKVTVNNRGYIDKNKRTTITAANSLYDADKARKTVNGVIYSHLDFSSTDHYTAYDDAGWNTVKFHVDSAEENQYVMVQVASAVKRVNGVYKVVTQPLANCINETMKAQSITEQVKGQYTEGIIRSGIAYPIKLTGKDFTIDFFDRKTNRFDMVPGSYKLSITPVRREGVYKYVPLACPGNVTLKVVAPPKANVKPAASVAFGISEGTVTKGDYSNFIKSPKYKEQGICYKDLKDVNIDGVLNGFHSNFEITDGDIGKIKYIGKDPIGVKDKDRDKKLQGWLMIEYQKVDGTVVEEPVKIKIVTKVDIKKK